jgi:L-alanine-DL-glutamate epimerase-like enolase superfamily enzyme
MDTLKILAETEKNQLHITAIKVFQLRGHGIQSIIKVETDAGIYGIGEAGLPAVIVQGYLDFMKESLLGQDALEIEKCYADMTRMRAQWHAHWTQNPTISGIDMALWDIAGKVFNRSVSRLLTGRFRNEIQLYVNTGGPKNWFDKVACRDWADEMKAEPHGFKTFKFGFEALLGKGLPSDTYRGGFLSPMLTQTDLKIIRQGYENCRNALGWEHDIIIHCHNEWDLPSALGIAEAVASIKPLWIEDALPVIYSDTWKSFRQSSPVRVMTGEKLEHPAEFLQFISNGAVDAIHPDLAFVGGLTGGRKIADLAELFYIPVVTHNVGSVIQLIANAHYGASVRNFVMSENRIPAGDLYDQMTEEGITVKDGKLKVPDGPGLGITLLPEFLNTVIENGKWS